MSGRSLVLSIDQGTTGSRAFVFSEDGRVVSSAYREFTQYYPRPGWVEHDPMEILRSVFRVVEEAVDRRGLWKRIGAIGITNQRETFVLWDRRTGRPVAGSRAIVWQCRRSAEICADLRGRGLERAARARTGLVLDPYFSGTKVRWMMDHVAGLRARVKIGDVCFGTIDAWLLWHLTGGTHATDFTNASRTLMFNIRKRAWDPELLDLLGVPAALHLPAVRPSAGRFGVTRGAAGLPGGIPITGMAGDQQAALFGQGATRAGGMKNTYGTGCFLMLHTGDRFVLSGEGLLTTLACDSAGGPAYALEGSVFIAGAAVQWLRDGIEIIRSSAESERWARSVPDSAGVVVVPAFTGLGAPHWRPDARGAIFGLTRGATRAHLIRATLESIAYQTCDVFDLMRPICSTRKPSIRIRELRVDGGATRNNFLMQFQADLLGLPVVRPRMAELTSWGAARLAGIGASMWSAGSADPAGLSGTTVFRPRLSRARAAALQKKWRICVRRVV